MTREEQAERRNQMRAYKAEGHTTEEVSERFGMSAAYTQQICKGIAPQTNRRPKEYKNQYTAGKFDREANAIRHINERTPWFEYAGNYTGIDGYVDLRCRTCGTVTRRSFVTVKHRSAKCKACADHETQTREAQREALKTVARTQREKDRERRRHDKLAHAACVQLTMTACQCCGGLFVNSGAKKYCSSECSKRVRNAIKKDRRIRKMRNVIVDNNITLEALYKRDNGKCYICGRVCDWNDYTVNDGGAFIANDSYPSIDHVTPLSRGGKHAWENVKLACRRCNNAKRDRIDISPCDKAHIV